MTHTVSDIFDGTVYILQYWIWPILRYKRDCKCHSNLAFHFSSLKNRYNSIFMYSSKCQTLYIVWNNIQQQTSKKSRPFFQYLHCRPQFGRVDAIEQKRWGFQKKPQEFLSKKKASKMLLLSWGKNEKRETKVVIQSGLRLKLSFEVFWKFFLFVLAPSPAALLLSPMREGRPRSAKKKFCHPQMIQNFIDWAL